MRFPPVVFVFDVCESGRRVSRQLCFSSSLRESLDGASTKRLGASSSFGAAAGRPLLAVGSVLAAPDLGLVSPDAEGLAPRATSASSAASHSVSRGARETNFSNAPISELRLPSLVITRKRRGPQGRLEEFVAPRHLRVGLRLLAL